MKKVPKYIQIVDIGKNPKHSENPDSINSHNISWQFSKIDNEGDWGLSKFLETTKFSINDGLLDALTKISDDLSTAVSNLDGKTFEGIDDFLMILHRECKLKITPEEQRLILRCIEDHFFWSEIFPKLKEFEQKNWFELQREVFGKKGKSKHHFVSVSDIIPKAQKRLSILRLDDIEHLFSLRLTGTLRIWGIKERSYLQFLWIDLDHQICPSQTN